MDSIVSSIIQQYQIRAEFGEKKYGVTLDREDLSIEDWIEHAKQEAMDLTLYLEKLKNVLGNQARYYDATGKFQASHETKDRIIYNLNKVIMSQEDEIKQLQNENKELRIDLENYSYVTETLEHELAELKKEDHTKKKRGWHF
jgi:predicted RNase H-like nuclease (RuvC/YqgF family)